ncbi:MAG: LysR family transcriptional regulator [Dehalococcoidales bacterium]|jgi:DNA-binding transcriptional LysR family regulator
MVPNLNPNDLVIFYVVAKEKSLSSAAEKLFLTQPAVTYHIQSLEEYTRVKLVEFKKRQIVLTSHGKDLLKYAGEIYHQLVDAERFIESIRESHIRIGIASVYDTFIGPLLNSMFETENPELKLTVKSGNAFEMVQDVVDAKLDLAIVPQFDYTSERLNHIQVSHPEKIVCFASFHQFIPQEPLEWKNLLDYPLVSGPDTSVIRRIIFSKFKSEGLPEPSLAAEVGSVEWCKNLVEHGKGLSFALTKDIQKELAEKRLKLVPLKEYVYTTAEAITRADVPIPIIKKFIEMVKQVFGYTEPKTVTPTPTDESGPGR